MCQSCPATTQRCRIPSWPAWRTSCLLGRHPPFSASDALSAALGAGVMKATADIGTAIDDLEDAGVLRQVQKDPPRWEVIDHPS